MCGLTGETVAKTLTPHKCLQGAETLPPLASCFLRNEGQEGRVRKEEMKPKGPEETITSEITDAMSRKEHLWETQEASAAPARHLQGPPCQWLDDSEPQRHSFFPKRSHLQLLPTPPSPRSGLLVPPVGDKGVGREAPIHSRPSRQHTPASTCPQRGWDMREDRVAVPVGRAGTHPVLGPFTHSSV